MKQKSRLNSKMWGSTESPFKNELSFFKVRSEGAGWSQPEEFPSKDSTSHCRNTKDLMRQSIHSKASKRQRHAIQQRSRLSYRI